LKAYSVSSIAFTALSQLRRTNHADNAIILEFLGDLSRKIKVSSLGLSVIDTLTGVVSRRAIAVKLDAVWR
jgi:hypothetical protein